MAVSTAQEGPKGHVPTNDRDSGPYDAFTDVAVGIGVTVGVGLGVCVLVGVGVACAQAVSANINIRRTGNIRFRTMKFSPPVW
jgi:hypothetical protein